MIPLASVVRIASAVGVCPRTFVDAQARAWFQMATDLQSGVETICPRFC